MLFQLDNKNAAQQFIVGRHSLYKHKVYFTITLRTVPSEVRTMTN